MHLSFFKQELKQWHGQNLSHFLPIIFSVIFLRKIPLQWLFFFLNFEMHSILVFKVFVLHEYHLNKVIEKYLYFESIKCKWCVEKLDREKNNMVITLHLKSKNPQNYGNHILFENYYIIFFMVIYISKVDSDLTHIRTIPEV